MVGAVVTPGAGVVAGLPVVRKIALSRPAADVFTFGSWLVWSTDPDTQTGRRATAPSELDALNLDTHKARIIRADQPGAIVNVATGAGDRLVWREVHSASADSCSSSMGCFTWTLWSTDLVTGARVELSRSAVPGGPTANPIPAADGSAVAWQQLDAKGRVITVTAAINGGSLRTVARGPSASQVSCSNGYVYLDDGSVSPPRLLRVPVTGGTVQVLTTKPAFYRPKVSGPSVTLVAGRPPNGMSVLAGSVSAPASLRAVYRSDEIYYAWPTDNGAVVVRDFQGAEVVSSSGRTATLPYALLGSSAVAVSANDVTLLVGDREDQIVMLRAD